MKTFTAATVVWVYLSSLVAVADGQLAKAELPADGTWVRYHVEVKKDAQPGHTYTYTLSLVGTEKKGDEVYRWVELKFDEGNDVTFVEKYLIPQSALLESENPAAQVVRGWNRVEKVVKAVDNKHSPAYTEPLLFLPGPLSKARELKEKKSIKYQNGSIEVAQGLTGTATAEYPRFPGKATRKIKYSAWLHPDIPLGVAAARTSMQIYQDGEQFASVECNYSVEATGTGAKSSLPEN